MKKTIKNKDYDLPTLAQIGDYRYAAEVFCKCEENNEFDDYVKTVKNWIFDGIYCGSYGELICFTCPICGDKFCFHCRNYSNWENWGFFEKYIK